MARGIEVTLLGQTLTLRSDLDPDTLHAIVEFVRRRAEEAGRGALTASPASLALLTALNVAEEFFSARARAEASEVALRDVEARAGRLVELIDARLPAEGLGGSAGDSLAHIVELPKAGSR